MIYTSYFAQLKNIPDNIVPITNCGKAPDWYTGIQYKKLAPKYDFFVKWKQNNDNNYYIKCFIEQVLSKLNAKDVEQELYKLSNNKDVVLICYEKPENFCHRHIVSAWLNYNRINCTEWINHTD